MSWFKRNLRKIGIIVTAGLLLAWAVWMSFSVLGTQIGRAPAINTGTVQAAPTVNTTAVVQDQLKQQDDKLKRDNSFPWTILNTIGGSILLGVAAFASAWFGFTQWRGNRAEERKKRAEERFQKVVEGLGSERGEAKVGAAIVLRTFLQEKQGYEQFYSQTFDLAVAHLRLRGTNSAIPEQPSSSSPSPIIILNKPLAQREQGDLNTPLSLDSLSQALITVFKESFPLARDWIKKQSLQGSPFNPTTLDATDVQLDNAYLQSADLVQCWLVQASLREAVLGSANLEGAELSLANLERAFLVGANLKGAELNLANLEGAILSRANLEGAILKGATLSGTDLRLANLEGAELNLANLKGADLSLANLEGTNPEDAYSLKDTKMKNVIGLTPEQREACIRKGAIFESSKQSSDPDTSLSTSFPVPPQSNEPQSSSVTPTQGNAPTPNIGGSS